MGFLRFKYAYRHNFKHLPSKIQMQYVVSWVAPYCSIPAVYKCFTGTYRFCPEDGGDMLLGNGVCLFAVY
jgi:hypothetical protein